jgi:hypothetical protein
VQELIELLVQDGGAPEVQGEEGGGSRGEADGGHDERRDDGGQSAEAGRCH